MYKDKSKQKQAQRERTRRYRAKQKGVTSEGVTDKALQAGHSTGKDGMVLGALGIQHPGNTAPTTQNTDEQAGAGGTKSVGLVQMGRLSGFSRVLDDLPPEPTRPTGHTTPATAKMTSQQLKTRLSLYHGLDWISSPEYAETIYRLLTWSLDDLKASGQSVPAWANREPSAV